MKYFWLLVLVFGTLGLSAQVEDDFSDGDFTANPTWEGETDLFQMYEDGSNFQLRSNGQSANDTASIVIANTAMTDIEWRFDFRLNLDPSNNNNLRVYLVSDQANLEGPLNGYFLLIGENGAEDGVDLYKQTGEEIFLIGESSNISTADNPEYTIKVLRDASGNWQVLANISETAPFELVASATDNEHSSTAYFGFFCKHSSTNNTNFFFDNIYIGEELVDNEAPIVEQVSLVSSTQLDIYFSENIQTADAENLSNYVVDNSVGNPISATKDGANGSLVHLTFDTEFIAALTYNIAISGINDISSNTMTASAHDFILVVAQAYNVLMTELMADPDPVVGLPNLEYIEIFNRGELPINLEGWELVEGEEESGDELPAYQLEPQAYLILCKEANVDSFNVFGPTLGLSTFAGLTNGGELLILKDPTGAPIHSLEFSSDWYVDAAKEDGGWSLEMIDTNNPCEGANNWIASNDLKGGTPGQPNSVAAENPDLVRPALMNALYNDTLQSVILYFTEALNTEALSLVDDNGNIQYEINNGLSFNNNISFFQNNATLSLGLDTPPSTATIYTITVSGVKDCAGNALSEDQFARIALGEEMEEGDIVINEILANPVSGNVRFIELYNRSNKIIDLQKSSARISRGDLETDLSNDQSTLISPDLPNIIYPQDYIVLTQNPDLVRAQYECQNPFNFVTVPDLPSYDDRESIVRLQAGFFGFVVDEVRFLDDWHNALIDDEDGVSLERISYEADSNDANNWHSAAAAVGYATPTYQNSQFLAQAVPESTIEINPTTFSPDGDGYEDFTQILYELDEPGYTVNITIYDDRGREIKRLVQNELLNQSGNYKWDGSNADGEKAPIGIYIIFTEIFKLDGSLEQFKKTCVLAGNL